jgi:hypothetical protein
MNNKRVVVVDNRDAGEMYEYLEARIDALKRRIAELEADNQLLRLNHLSDGYLPGVTGFASRGHEVHAFTGHLPV